jgi:predicted CXXCH cytochrome family protein
VARVRLLLIGGILFCACEAAPPVVQPIQYNHKAHIDNGIACTSCHQSVEKAAAATVPALDMCMMCHQAALSDNPEEEKVRQYAERGEEIPWRRIYQLPEHVYFSHRRHVAVAGVECGQCHGAVASLTAPPPYPLVAQTMSWCLTCHRARGATQDCIHCHR